MALNRLIIHEHLKGIGVAGLVGSGLLLAVGAYAVLTLVPAWHALDTLREQTRQADEYVAQVEQGSAAAPVVPQHQLDEFHRKLPAQQQATVAIDKVYALAAEEHIALSRGDYALGIDPKTHLARYQILLPVHGSYPQLRRFLHALLGQLPAVVVEDVELQRKRIDETDLSGRIRMTLYLSRS